MTDHRKMLEDLDHIRLLCMEVLHNCNPSVYSGLDVAVPGPLFTEPVEKIREKTLKMIADLRAELEKHPK